MKDFELAIGFKVSGDGSYKVVLVYLGDGQLIELPPKEARNLAVDLIIQADRLEEGSK